MYTCEIGLKTAHETEESVGMIGKSKEFRGKLGGNWGIVFPQWGHKIPWRGKQFPPRRGKKGKMKGNCFTKIPIWGICVKQVGEIKGK